MFHMNNGLKVMLAVEPVDLRKNFNGLYTIARNELGEVPEDGALFIFSNRTRTRIKVLCFDGLLGFCETFGKRNVQLAKGSRQGDASTSAGSAESSSRRH